MGEALRVSSFRTRSTFAFPCGVGTSLLAFHLAKGGPVAGWGGSADELGSCVHQPASLYFHCFHDIEKKAAFAA